jgi:hypothetical protein
MVHNIVVIAINNSTGNLSIIADPPATVINADFGFSSTTTLTPQINNAQVINIFFCDTLKKSDFSYKNIVFT